VVVKYGVERERWCSWVRSGSYGRGFWKFIRKDWHYFSSHIRFIPGNGSRISFWEESWCGSSPLMEVYLGLFSIASNKEASIADNLGMVSGSCQWNVCFTHSLNDWEVDELASLYSLLYSCNLDGGGDKIWWVHNKKGKFEVRSFYNEIISKASRPFPWKSIQRTKDPPRMAFFVWSAAFGKILTLDNLERKVWC
jgi:hypothetical protein